MKVIFISTSTLMILPAMCFNNTLSSNAKLILSKCRRKKSRPKPYREVTEICPLLPKKGNVQKVYLNQHIKLLLLLL